MHECDSLFWASIFTFIITLLLRFSWVYWRTDASEASITGSAQVCNM
jgi:hypothetical protein